MPKIKVVTLG